MRRIEVWKSIDWITVVLCVVLMLIGWISIYAAVYNPEYDSILDLSQRYGKQLLWIGGALVVASVILLIDSKLFTALSFPFYIVTMLCLLFVIVLGREVNGAKSWFELGSFKFQPSEIAKFATAMALAKLMGGYGFSISKMSDFIKIVGVIFMPIVLIMLQPDLGSVLVYTSFIFVLYREGLRAEFLWFIFISAVVSVCSLIFSHISVIGVISLFTVCYLLVTTGQYLRVLYGAVLSFSLLFIVWLSLQLLGVDIDSGLIILLGSLLCSIVFIVLSFTNRLYGVAIWLIFHCYMVLLSWGVSFVVNTLFEEHQKNRIEVLLGLREDPYNDGYHVNQSLIAIGSGGLNGKGFLKGTQTKYDFVPEQATDFIFCTVGEEWGFWGASFVLLIFLIFLWRLIYLAERQRSVYSRVYGYCVVMIFFYHVGINIAMTIGLAPVIGIPLPFFSYGGSSLISFTVLLFIFLRLDANRKELFA